MAIDGVAPRIFLGQTVTVGDVCTVMQIRLWHILPN